MRKYYPGITLFKLLGCILVVLSHIIIPIFYSHTYHNLAFLSLLNIVVPCFYITSGFLACQGWSNAQNPDKYVTRYLTRIILIYLLFVLIYTGTDLVNAAVSGKTAVYFSWATLKKLIVITLLKGPYAQLWFIPPLIFGMAASYYLIKKVSLNTALIIGSAIFIIAMFTIGSPHVLIKNINFGNFYGQIALREITRHFVGEGFTYVLTGVLIAKHENMFFKINLPALIILSVCVTAAEYFLLQSLPLKNAQNSSVISSLPNSILLFYGILHIKANWIKPYHREINLFTIVIFFAHYLLLYINSRLLDFKITNMNVVNTSGLLALIFIEGAAITYLIIKFKKNRAQVATVNA